MSTTDFRQKLVSLCEASSTGTIFLVTENQRQARIGLTGGRITHLGMRPLNGIAALATIATTAFVSFRFLEGDAPPAHADLPPTPEILNMFTSGTPPAPVVASAAKPATRHVTPLPAELLHAVEKELVEQFGPIAKMLVDEQRTLCSTLEELLDALAPNFDNASEAAKFATQVKKHLRL